MCTAIGLKMGERYFGRNLDLDRSYGEEICVLPRRLPLSFRMAGEQREHHAIIGMASVAKGVPLLFDGANEYGLAGAGLNFPGNAAYTAPVKGKDNIAPFEILPWVLGQCKTVAEAKRLLTRINITDIAFDERLPNSPLHWMFSDGERHLVAESMQDGLHLYENPAGVLTNNPPFPLQFEHLKCYRHLRNDNAEVKKEESASFVSYSAGLGAVGLPGDVSSMSRFVRAAFWRAHAVSTPDEESAVGQFFHLLDTVKMVRGGCVTDEGTLDVTVYSACINADRGRYYYTTCGNRRITCVDMRESHLDGETLCRFPLLLGESINYQNKSI